MRIIFRAGVTYDKNADSAINTDSIYRLSVFSAKRKNDINHKLFNSMLIMGIVNLTFDIVTVYTVNHLEEVSSVVNRVCHDIFVWY